MAGPGTTCGNASRKRALSATASRRNRPRSAANASLRAHHLDAQARVAGQFPQDAGTHLERLAVVAGQFDQRPPVPSQEVLQFSMDPALADRPAERVGEAEFDERARVTPGRRRRPNEAPERLPAGRRGRGRGRRRRHRTNPPRRRRTGRGGRARHPPDPACAGSAALGGVAADRFVFGAEQLPQDEDGFVDGVGGGHGEPRLRRDARRTRDARQNLGCRDARAERDAIRSRIAAYRWCSSRVRRASRRETLRSVRDLSNPARI